MISRVRKRRRTDLPATAKLPFTSGSSGSKVRIGAPSLRDRHRTGPEVVTRAHEDFLESGRRFQGQSLWQLGLAEQYSEARAGAAALLRGRDSRSSNVGIRLVEAEPQHERLSFGHSTRGGARQ